MKKDEESSNEKCTKNRETMREKYEKDKEEILQREARNSEASNPSQFENREVKQTGTSSTESTQRDRKTDDDQSQVKHPEGSSGRRGNFINSDRTRTNGSSDNRNINSNHNSNNTRVGDRRENFFGGSFNNDNDGRTRFAQ